MKLATKIGLFTLSTTCLFVGQVVRAEVVGEGKTTGIVKFVTDEGPGSIIEPDPKDDEDVVIVMPKDEGVSSNGALRIQFVPNFRFGTYNGIVASAIKRPVELLTMKDKTGTTTHGQIAPFVQVTDGRGLGADEDESKWTLTAYATPFENGTKNLGESNISLDGSTLTTTMGDNKKAEAMIDGHTPGEAISMIETAPTVIMKTKDGKSSSGYQVSNVFQNDYVKGMAYPNIDEKIPSTYGVTFNKVKNVSPMKDIEYTSTITWTLTSGI